MCLITTEGHAKIMTAKKDIVVYKGFYQKDNVILSPIRCHKYILNIKQHCKCELQFKEAGEEEVYFDTISQDHFGKSKRKLFAISEGIHSFRNKRRALDNKINNSLVSLTLECIIPKGAKYALDYNGLCVSDQIIVTDKEIW